MKLLQTATEASAWVGLPASTLLAKARRNEIPHVRLGRLVRFNEAALKAWAEGHNDAGGDTDSLPVNRGFADLRVGACSVDPLSWRRVERALGESRLLLISDSSAVSR